MKLVVVQKMVLLVILGVGLTTTAFSDETILVSVDSNELQANNTTYDHSISGNGRFVTFQSSATNLVPNDTNGERDIFVRDIQNGTTIRVTENINGVEADRWSRNPSISANGRFVAYCSAASNLVSNTTNNSYDIYLYDTQNQTTERVSVNSNGVEGNGHSDNPSISADGRYVAFESYASNLVSGDTNGEIDIFVHDTQSGNTIRASVHNSGDQANDESEHPALSGNGQFVAFVSRANNLVSGDTNGKRDVFVHDILSAETTRVSVDSNENQANQDSNGRHSISYNGRYIAFPSSEHDFGGSYSTVGDVYVRDTQAGETFIVSVNDGGTTSGNGESYNPSISKNGRFVAFESYASNLVSGDTNNNIDVFVHDTLTEKTIRVSVDNNGGQVGSLHSASGTLPSISWDGSSVSFNSGVDDLVEDDTNGKADIFVRNIQINTPPSADAGGPYIITDGDQVILDGSDSFETDAGDSIVSYEWDIDNDGNFDDATGATPTITSTELANLVLGIGNHTISLKVTDQFSDTDTDNTSLEIRSSLPHLTITPLGPILPGGTQEFAVEISNADEMFGYRVAVDINPSQASYVLNSATNTGSLTETGWFDIVLNDTNPDQLIFTSASAINPITQGSSGTLLKFTLQFDNALEESEPVDIGFNNDLTDINDDETPIEEQEIIVEVASINDAPTFTKGNDQTVDEDSGQQTVPNWATSISAGDPDESTQVLTFNVNPNDSSLFSVDPSIDSNGTLTYTPAPNAIGSTTVEVVLTDDGGTVNGGDDTSDPQTFTITIDPVNDAPSFTAGADQTVDEDAGVVSIANWASDIIAGPTDELLQSLHFNVINSSNPNLLAATPIITATGTLEFETNANENGSTTLTVELVDDGGIANGGDDTSSPQTFAINVNPINDAPTLDVINDQTVLEDSSLNVDLSGILAGPANEDGQNLTVTATSSDTSVVDNPSVTYTSNNPTGQIIITPEPDANGSVVISVTVEDDASVIAPNQNSIARDFIVSITPVNDAPSFALGADRELLNVSGQVREVTNFATDIIAGPTNEAGQQLEFQSAVSHPQLFSVSPVISATDGTLTYTPAAGAHGIADITMTLVDDGGIANGGVDSSTSKSFRVTMYIPFIWGDLDGNGFPGAVDASLLLQFDAALIDEFPAYLIADYPEYYETANYPDPADVNADSMAGTLDASLILQQFALLIDYFPADTNQDDEGPDQFIMEGKSLGPQANIERYLSVRIEPGLHPDQWDLIFYVDNAESISGIRLHLNYDPAQAEVVEDRINWMIPGGIVVSNNTNPGTLIIAGALNASLSKGQTDLLRVPFKRSEGSTSETPLQILLNKEQTQINDGQLLLTTNTPTEYLVPGGATSVQSWMLY